MKKIVFLIAVCSLLTACGGTSVEVETSVEETTKIISETGEMETIDITDGIVTDTPEVEIIPSSDSDVVEAIIDPINDSSVELSE